ncbi:uncharacterized protein [Arachis hypogaea]|uniref:uncharacterized protein n=1 Tax=Arachis hypogaea TaxID=3818 RepID=UPI003B218866
MVKKLFEGFEEVTIQHVPRERNARVDLLSKLESTKLGTKNRSLIQGLVKEPSITLYITQASSPPSWIDPILRFLEDGELPEDERAARTCLRPDQMDYVLGEVHEGCCGHHIGGKALARKLVRAGYYWPSMMSDAQEFGIPEVVISDNGTQFTDKKFGAFLSGLGIKQKFSLVEHPQSNGQVEAANKIILQGLRKRLDQKKGSWLTYGFDAVIPVEIGEPIPRMLLGGVDKAAEKDMIDETREMTHLTETALKQRVALRYNVKVPKRSFELDDLVLRRNDIRLPTLGEGKLVANSEGPYKVREVLSKGAFKLERLDSEVPRTWNTANLKRFYP